jgi:hypothetical protein
VFCVLCSSFELAQQKCFLRRSKPQILQAWLVSWGMKFFFFFVCETGRMNKNQEEEA